MTNPIEKADFLTQIVTSGRIVLASMAVCCLLYGLLILGIAQGLTPYTADGSLIRNAKGVVIGSRFIAQGFVRPEYFWPRPSAVDYNAAASGGNNWSPTNPKLRARAAAIIAKLGPGGGKAVPADLVTASGSGLDPQITLRAAEYLAGRIASARGLPIAKVMATLHKFAKRPGGPFTPEPLVNVLLVNIALDGLKTGTPYPD
jgi:potassium-transporting ATPase KdpC subunit